MIAEDYVSFETAKLLKEKGFQAKCTACYRNDSSHTFELVSGRINYCNPRFSKYKMIPPYNAPTIQMAMKWLREIYHLDIEVRTHYLNRLKPNDIRYYSGKILKGSEDVIHTVYSKNTYEEVCEEAIKYCLENLI